MQNTYWKVIKLSGISLAVFIALKYTLPVWIPFFIALLLARMILPWTKWIKKYFRLKREVACFLILVFLTVIVGGAVYLLGSKLLNQLGSLMANAGMYLIQAKGVLNNCCRSIEKCTGIHATQVENFVYQNIDLVQKNLTTHTIPEFLKNSLGYLVVMGKWIGVVLVIYISVILLIKDYEGIKEKIQNKEIYIRIRRILSSLETLGGAWLRAQIIILLIVMAVCVIGLMGLKFPYALLMGIVVGLMDALPFIGTGSIFIPWGIYKVLTGKIGYGIGLLAIFFSTYVIREYLEPKLVGEKMGVHPLLMIAAVYIGIYVYGVSGVLLGPVSLFLILEIWKELETSEDEMHNL